MANNVYRKVLKSKLQSQCTLKNTQLFQRFKPHKVSLKVTANMKFLLNTILAAGPRSNTKGKNKPFLTSII